MPPAFRRTLIASMTAALLAATVACAAPASGDGPPSIVVGFYPMQFLTERIGGGAIKVTNLVKPGAEPHDLELTPQQRRDVRDARLVVHLAGFQPELDEAVATEAKDKAFDATSGIDKLDNDPHVWLDPIRFAAIGDRLADRLASLDAPSAATYRDRAAKLRADLVALDSEYAGKLANCQRRDLVTSHAAFAYLADRYRLNQVPISGLSPEDEPTPQRLVELSRFAKDKGVTTIFFETLVSPKVAQTLAKEVGATAEVLDPIEGLEDGTNADYLSVMRDNLRRLTAALGCA
jgi:zinc transport system substrate-binding protein